MPVRNLPTGHLVSILRARGVALPEQTQPFQHYVDMCAAAGVTEVPLAEVASLARAAPSELRSKQQKHRITI